MCVLPAHHALKDVVQAFEREVAADPDAAADWRRDFGQCDLQPVDWAVAASFGERRGLAFMRPKMPRQIFSLDSLDDAQESCVGSTRRIRVLRTAEAHRRVIARRPTENHFPLTNRSSFGFPGALKIRV